MSKLKSNLINYVKKSKLLYSMYFIVGNFLLKAIKHFVKPQKNLILFVSYGGRHFNDSPYFLYKAMLKDRRFSNFEFVWAFREPQKFEIMRGEKIKIDSFKYYITALKARCWITNVMIERALEFKGKNTYYFHTTHGTLPKLSGRDISNSTIFDTKAKYHYDCSCAQSEYEAILQTKMFSMKRENILISGYPKNDILANITNNDSLKMKKKLGIDQSKTVILYAPTFRENTSYKMLPHVNFRVWKEIIGNEYIILYRAHPVVVNLANIDEGDGFVIDVSNYPDVNDLMIASDILISDYSGIFFDYAILNKHMFCYTYDYDEYMKSRGLYFDIRNELPGGSVTEIELFNIIKNTSKEEAISKTTAFRKKYACEYGHATEKCLENIYFNINKG